MQVPAYCPLLLGVHAREYKGVSVDVKKTMAMLSIPIMMPDGALVEVAPGIELSIAMPDMVEVGEADIDMDMLLLMSVLGMKLEVVHRQNTRGG